MTTVAVRVPASAANVGPGYDAFGLALGIHNRFRACPAEEWLVDVAGEGEGDLDTGAANQVASAMAQVFARIPGAPRAAHIECDNRIPQGKGLGSSAAAIVGGLVLGDALCGAGLDRQTLFEMAVDIEGHPDNVAAALFGGFTIGWRRSGRARATSLPIAGGLAAVVALTHEPLSTSRSRDLLPESVPHADAAFNSARAGLLTSGLTLGRSDLLAEGLADCLHERYRASAIPDIEEVVAVLTDAGAIGAVLSGAGPAVIGLVGGETDDEAYRRAQEIALRATGRIAGMPGRLGPLALRIDQEGTVLEGER